MDYGLNLTNLILPTLVDPFMDTRDPHLWKQAKARAGFKMHLRTYLFVNVVLWLIWLVIFLVFQEKWGTYPWPLWTTLGWGIGLISHYFSVYHGFNEKNLAEREYEKLKRTHGL